MSKIEVLRSAMNICDTHVMRIQKALEHVKHLIPVFEDTIDKLSDTEVSFLDQITKRFGLLQDTIGNKVFPLILELLQEDVLNSTFIDRLHKLEKIGALENAEFWKKIRDLRNELAHEYPDEKIYMAKVLNNCLKESENLIIYWDFLKKFITNKLLLS